MVGSVTCTYHMRPYTCIARTERNVDSQTCELPQLACGKRVYSAVSAETLEETALALEVLLTDAASLVALLLEIPGSQVPPTDTDSHSADVW